jgi:broad specificity phosphatase PhoE
VIDPPLSELGHRQASETAAYLHKIVKDNDNEEGGSGFIHKILVSPYLRVIQTAPPTAHAFGIPLSIENGLSEAHAHQIQMSNRYYPLRINDLPTFQYLTQSTIHY